MTMLQLLFHRTFAERQNSSMVIVNYQVGPLESINIVVDKKSVNLSNLSVPSQTHGNQASKSKAYVRDIKI